MKVKYTPVVLDLIAAVTGFEGLKPQASWVQSLHPTTAEWPEGLRSIVHSQFTEKMVEERLDGLKERYDTRWISTDATVVADGWEVKFSFHEEFKTREALMTWAKARKIKLPKECDKEGELKDGEIHTIIRYRIELDDLTMKLSYTRKGAPTAHCRVHSQVYTSVVCDLH